jgi:hypothetical protein
MIFLSRSWHERLANADNNTTIATIADSLPCTGEAFLEPSFRAETGAQLAENSIRLE